MSTAARTILLTVAAAVLVAMLALFCIFRFLLPAYAAENTTPPAYTIGAWEGKVAVFEGEDPYPMQVLDTPVNALPAEVRSQVESGVPVNRAEDLYLILEDYTD